MIEIREPSSSVAAAADLERLGEEVAALAAHVDSATYRLLVRLREFDEREGWGGGFASCAHWLSWRAGIAPGAAREKVRVARALACLPLLGAAMERCELSFSKVRALTRIATPANEEELLELARHATAAQVERIVRAWRRIDRAEEADQERERHEHRYLTVHADDDGSYVVRGRLDPEVGALLERALEAAAKALYEQEQLSDCIRAEAATAAQRRADALGLLIDLAVSNRDLMMDQVPDEPADAPALCSETGRLAPSDSHARFVAAERNAVAMGATSLGRAGRLQVVLHVDAEALRAKGDGGQAVLAGGARVSAETSRRLACDASRVIMTHDAASRVLDVGRRTRIVPTAIRRALEHRDGGCRFPGCGNRFVDAHHVQHWADDGPTHLDNLLLLCRRHHRLVHEEGYGVRRNHGGEFAFSRPDGRVIPPAPAMPRDRCRCATGEVSQAGFGASWASHWRFDLGWALRALYRPEPRPTGVSA